MSDEGGAAADAEPRRLVVAAALVEPDGRLLAARRSGPSQLAGGWEFPGGKVEPGEDPDAALHRELAEELGVTVVLGALVPGPLGGVEEGCWRLSDELVLLLRWARLVSGTPAPLQDHDALRWLPPEEWASVPWLPADGPIVEHLADAWATTGYAVTGLPTP